ncbi:histidine kinase [Streptomyces sp. NPDC049040]|uniref:histidine kinase n=1 Tax=Streptomyces sp. NPDC049040 TaxID=3365593 RepID=UPI00370FBF4B
MIEPLVTTATLLGGGLAATAAGLVAQTRAKRTAVARAGELADRVHAAERAADARAGALNRRVRAAEQQAAALAAEIRHLARVRLPALVDTAARGHRGVTVPGLADEALKGTPVDEQHQAVLDLCSEAIGLTRETIGLAARSTVRDLVDEAQTYLVRCQMAVIDEMDKVPEATAFQQGLMNVDHPLTRSVHTLQRLRILAGSWPGLQRADCTFAEIVESARGRIDPYLRVHYTHEPSTGGVWVEGRVVEPVTIALTELLSNATSYSDGKVLVEVQQTQTGWCVLVDDSGLNMSPQQRAQAERLLSKHTVLDVTSVPDTLSLGFPVIGRLTAAYDFRVDVSSTSPYGGVRAVLHVPRELLGAGPTQEEQAAERQTARSAMGVPVRDLPAAPQTRPESGRGLPQRRRHRSRPAAPAGGRTGAPAPQEDPEAFSEGFAGLAAAIRDGEDQHPEGEHPDD